MKMIVWRCSILTAIILIPFTSIQHFIPPLDDCLLADICNHTWIPECAEDFDLPYSRRLFIDECDVWEFNCDNDVKYLIVNYSDCFGPMTCPTIKTPKYIKQGNYLYMRDGRRIVYSPTKMTTTPIRRTTVKMKTKPGKRRYTPIRGRNVKKKKKPARRFTLTTECAPCMRTNSYKPVLKKPVTKKPVRPPGRWRLKSTRTTKKLTTHAIVTTRITTQVIRTATVGTVVLRRMTVIKNGMTMFKVIKGYASVTTTIKEDSDFLE